MGSNSSVEKIYAVPNGEQNDEEKISKEDIQNVRQSWKEIGDFKTHGVKMMIKLDENLLHYLKIFKNLCEEFRAKK